jgi:uncharacterized membrane protein YhhN
VIIDRSRRLLLLAISAAAVCVLQIVAMIRHVHRLPHDRFGIVLYSVIILALAAAAIWAAIGWVRNRN